MTTVFQPVSTHTTKIIIMNNINNNQGIVLLIALVFLFVSTLLGVSALRSNFFNEKMTLNSIQRKQALEVAEMALLRGEEFVEKYNQQIVEGVITGTGSNRTVTNRAKLCLVVIDGEGGICSAKEQSDKPSSQYANWVDIASDNNSINAWSTNGRHRNLDEVIKHKYALNTAPKYIVEFLGYIVDSNGFSACAAVNKNGDLNLNADTEQLDSWPYCNLDNAQFRITAFASTGNYDETRVMLQTTYVTVN